MIFPNDVPGWLDESEGRRLAELAAGKVVLEIGSYKGRSTICMAQTAAVVHALDWFCGDDGAGWGWTLPEFFTWLDRYGVRDNVVAHVGRTEAVGPVLSEAFGFAFVDGAHDYESVRVDLELARRVCHGPIAVHDSHYADVARATRDVLGWDGTQEVVGSLQVGECLSRYAPA